jgi:dethiobiotin synthetase
MAQSEGTLFIEGVGGVMVPLDHRHTVLDWIAELKLPVILVTGSYLGTLSHTLTAVDALRRRGAAIVSLIVNESDGSSVSLGDTLATLSRFVSDAPIATLPRFGAGGDGARAHAAFHELASACGIDRA